MKQDMEHCIKKRYDIWNAVPGIAKQSDRSHYTPSSLEIDLYNSLINLHFPFKKNHKRMLVLGVTEELIKLESAKGFDVTCVDFSSKMIDLKKTCISDNGSVKVIQEEWSRMEFPQHHFSLIVGDCAINNVPKEILDAFLTKIHHILSLDGLCIFKEIVRVKPEKTETDLKDLIQKYNKSKITWSNFYTSLRFDHFLLPDTYREESKELFGDLVFKKIENSRFLDNETKKKLLRFKNSVTHTIYTKDELTSALADKFGTCRVTSNLEHEVFSAFIIDKTATLFDYNRRDSEYISTRNYQFMDVIARNIINEFAHLCVIDWEIGKLNDIKSGNMQNADIRIKIPNGTDSEETRIKYLSTIPLYGLLKSAKEKGITNFLFKQDDVTCLTVAIESGVDKIKINMSGNSTNIVFPQQLISKIRSINELKILIHFLLEKGYNDYLKEKLKTGLTCLKFGNLSKNYYEGYSKECDANITNKIDINNIFNQIRKLVDTHTETRFKKYIDSLLLPCIRTLLFGISTNYECNHLRYYVYPSLMHGHQEIALIGLMLFSNKEIQFYDKIATKDFIKDYCTSLSIWKWGDKVRCEVTKHALKSAISAIMSRNGSHNIGSHVIYNVIKDIDMLNVQDNKYLFKYLQQRMDFVAQISTGWAPEWTSSSWLVKELMKGFFEQAHVLNYIAKSEGLQVDSKRDTEKIRKISKHVFKCKKGKTKKDLIIQIELGDDGLPQTEEDEASSGANLDEDVPIAVPGGNIGFHAFYTIIENFIRNAAKHEFSSLPDKFKKQKNLRVNIELEEDDDRKAYTVRVWDNLSYISNVMSHNEEPDDNPFKVDDKNSNKIENNNENFFNDLKLREHFIKLIVIKADEQVLKISAKDVQLEQLQTECKAISKNGGYFIIHPYEKYGNKNELYRPCVIPRLSELIKNTNIRFVSQPRWESFLSGFNEKDKGKTEEKLKRFLEDNWLPIHCKINNEFAKDLINEDGSLRKESWGLSEMRISAGYLQKKEILDVGNGKQLKETEFIKAIAIPELVGEDEQNVRAYRLGYKFKLLKPKEVLIVGLDSDDLYNEDNRNFLEKESIFLRKNIDFLDDFDFEFIVIVGDEVGKFLEQLNEGNKHEFLEKFPYRIILASDSNAEVVENDSFLSKRIAACEEDALVGKKLSKYLSDAISTKKVTQSENENSKEITPLETLKLRVYEKWVEHLKCVCQGKDSSEDVYLVVKTNEGRNPDKIAPDFKEFFSILEKRPLGLTLNINKKKKLKKAIRQAFGFYNKAHKPRTLPEELFDLKSGDVAGKPLACSFNSKLNKLSLDSLEDFRGKYHDNAISYLRHKPLCEELQCSPPHNPIYDENISGGANHFPIVANIPPENVNPYIFRKMLLKLIENGLFKIAIADERCLDYLAERSSLAGELTRCGVYPVKQVLSYMESPALEESCKIIAIDQDDDRKIKITYEKEFAPDAIIIHQGILDKINWGNYNYEDQEQFLIQLKEKIPFLAITSGRGEPPNLPKAAKFMGFSIIEQHILSDPHSKLLLTDSFMKLSRGGEA